MRSVLLTAMIGALVISACGNGSQQTSSTRASTTSFQNQETSNTTSFGGAGIPPGLEGRLDVVDIDPKKVLDDVLRDAEGRTGVELEKLRITDVEQSQWPDASLGCPQPGRVYAQVVSTGNRVVVNAGDQTIEYRVSTSGDFWPCDE